MSARAFALALLAVAAVAAGARDAGAQVEARLQHRSLSVGESTTLTIAVQGGGRAAPEFDLPAGLEVLGSSQSQSFSWINGKSTSETVYRYEIGPSAAGRYTIGPIRVKVGDQVYESATLTLDATAAPQRVGGRGGAGPAQLIVEAIPSDPVVGQLVTLRVRLVQRVAFAEDPQYTPPTTTGFWTDKPSAPESFYADQGSQRVLVTETRTRLYPVAPGVATIGDASATVVIAVSSALDDPFAWLSGRGRREMLVRSRPVPVRVRPLPAGAPPGFTGAVGDFEVTWTADRPRTSRDVPITLHLEVRGRGNLPLVRPPTFRDDGVEVFASTVDDSLSEPGSDQPGRKRFQWTVLPKKQGVVELSPPAFSWYDPAAGAYRRAESAPVSVEVGPSLFSGSGERGEFPAALAARPIDPGERRADPWAWALAGLVLGAAAALWRAAGARPASGAQRARQLEWLRAVGQGRGADFWRAADEASAWLEEQRHPVRGLREQIAAARYAGGAGADPEPVRRRVVEQLSRALPPAHPRTPLRIGALVLAVAAIAWAALFGPRAGEAADRRAALAADQAARTGDLAQARAGWWALWKRGLHHPGLAARLAWSDIEGGALGPASLWVMRGEVAEPRDPAVGWVTERVREAGGLVGAAAPRVPVTRLEWSLAAIVLGLAAGALWERRRLALALVALTVLCGVLFPLQGWWVGRSGRAVVLRAAPLEGEGIELQPGQVVTIEERRPGRARVAAGSAVRGWMRDDAIGAL